nr:MAG TPA: hypothetical protein [Caudoviricetes sp.]
MCTVHNKELNNFKNYIFLYNIEYFLLYLH